VRSGLTASSIGRRCAEDLSARGLQKDRRVGTYGRLRERQDQRRAAPGARGLDAANDIDVDDRSTGILASLDRGLMLAVEGDEPEPTFALPGPLIDSAPLPTASATCMGIRAEAAMTVLIV